MPVTGFGADGAMTLGYGQYIRLIHVSISTSVRTHFTIYCVRFNVGFDSGTAVVPFMYSIGSSGSSSSSSSIVVIVVVDFSRSSSRFLPTVFGLHPVTVVPSKRDQSSET